MEVIEKNSWNLEQINNYCIGKGKKSFKFEYIIIIALSIFSFILITVVIIMAKIIRKNQKNVDYDKKLVSDEEHINFSSGRTS